MTTPNMPVCSVRPPHAAGVAHVLNQLDERKTSIGGRLDALISLEADIAKRAERRDRRLARLAVALAVMAVLASAYSWRR